MTEMSQEFWTKHAYGPNEPDRVVLCVSLQAERDGSSGVAQNLCDGCLGRRKWDCDGASGVGAGLIGGASCA